jgi:hypothetical protein
VLRLRHAPNHGVRKLRELDFFLLEHRARFHRFSQDPQDLGDFTRCPTLNQLAKPENIEIRDNRARIPHSLRRDIVVKQLPRSHFAILYAFFLLLWPWGEFYLNAAFDRYGDLDQARQHIVLYDSALKDDLLGVSAICDVESCRKSDYHSTPFFAEEFAEKHARALVGYSESLNGALVANADATKCPMASACRADANFDVEELPLDDKGAHTISWVDSFTLDKNCKDQCAKDAVAFIQFVDSDDIFLLALLPAGGPPAYLLPAKASLYSNSNLLAKAHLYPKLKTIIEGAAVPSALSLNEELRNAGRQLDADLPQQ